MAKLYNETGFSRIKPDDKTCTEILDFVKPLVELSNGKNYNYFKCEHYMEKPTYGTNYKIKVKTPDDYLHLHVYKPPSGYPQVNLIERGRRADDDLALPFDIRNITPSIKAGSFWNYS